MMDFKKIGLAAGFAAMAAYSTSAQAVIIDTFDAGGVNATTALPSCTDVPAECAGGDGPANLGLVENAAGADAIGGFRDVTAWMQSKTSINPADDINVSAGFGTFALSSDDGTRAHSWIQWDGDDAAVAANSNPLPTSVTSAANTDTAGNLAALAAPSVTEINYGVDRSGLGGVDLTANGEVAVAIDFVTSDSDDFQVFMWFWRQGAAADEFATALFEVDAIDVPTTLQINMAAFTFSGGEDVSLFSNVGAIELHMHGRTNQGNHTATDISIDNIRTVVPVPQTLALLGFGLVGLGAMGRRRRG